MSAGLVGRKNVTVFDERRNTSRVFPVEPGAADRAIAEFGQHPELPELHLNQRWRARCEDCGWIGDERHFRERAAMDGRKHTCERGRP